MINKISLKLQKLKAMFEHPATPKYEAETAKRIYDRVKAAHGIEDWSIVEFGVSGKELEILKRYGVNVIEDEDGEREYQVMGDNQIGVDMALHDIFSRAIKKRQKKRIDNSKKLLEE